VLSFQAAAEFTERKIHSRNMSFPFEEAPAYDKAVKFAGTCRKVACRLPEKNKSDSDRLVSSSTTVCSSIAEGYTRWEKEEKKEFYLDARRALLDCVCLLNLLGSEELVAKEESDETGKQSTEISVMLSSIVKNISEKN
ncbi:MAG: four helix bundle protein, partial [Fibrobacterota bacterium]